jgi:di/tricarboxylate transporter
LGGVATYFTTANIIASDLLTHAAPPQAPLSVLSFTPTGGLIALAGILFISVFSKWLLPSRSLHPDLPADRSMGSELEVAYQLGERLWEARVLAGSPLAGKVLAESAIGRRLGVSVVAIWRGLEKMLPPNPAFQLRHGDILIVIGREDRVGQLAADEFGLEVHAADQKLSPRGVTFVEVIPAPRSGALGTTLKATGFRNRTGFTAVALWRGQRSYRTDVADFELQPGDSLLLVGPQHRLAALQRNPDFIALEPDWSDQPIPRRPALLAVGLIGGAIAASVLGAPTYLAILVAAVAAVAVVLLGLVPIREAYREMEWSAIFLVGGMFAASTALVNTGLAALIGRQMIVLVEPLGPLGLAAGGFLLAAALTQVMQDVLPAHMRGSLMDQPERQPAGHRGGHRDRLLGRLPDPGRAPGQRPGGRPRQLPLQRLRPAGVGADVGVVWGDAGGDAAVLGIVRARAQPRYVRRH